MVRLLHSLATSKATLCKSRQVLRKTYTSPQMSVVRVRLLSRSLLTWAGRVCDESNQTANSDHMWAGDFVSVFFPSKKRAGSASIHKTLSRVWKQMFEFVAEHSCCLWYLSGKGQCFSLCSVRLCFCNQPFDRTSRFLFISSMIWWL